MMHISCMLKLLLELFDNHPQPCRTIIISVSRTNHTLSARFGGKNLGTLFRVSSVFHKEYKDYVKKNLTPMKHSPCL